MTTVTVLPVRRIIRAVASAAERWCNADFAPRVRATQALCARTRYSEPMVEYALDQLFSGCTAHAVAATITRELGSLDVLDEFSPVANSYTARAVPIGEITVLSSRTTIGVALEPAVFALCAKNRVNVKDRSDGLIAAFFATLREEEPHLAPFVQAQAWNGHDEYNLAQSAAVVVFGSDETVAEIRRTAPSARIIAYGSRVSCGIISLEHMLGQPDFYARAARDAALYEGEGCMSLHALFVLTSEAAHDASFVGALRNLHGALETTAVEFPPADFDDAAARRIGHAQRAYQFEAAAAAAQIVSGPTSTVYVSAKLPLPLLPRRLLAIPVRHMDDVRAYVTTQHLPLSTIAYEAADVQVAENVHTLAASRFTAFGSMQQPPFGAPRDFQSQISAFVAWQIDQATFAEMPNRDP